MGKMDDGGSELVSRAGLWERGGGSGAGLGPRGSTTTKRLTIIERAKNVDDVIN